MPTFTIHQSVIIDKPGRITKAGKKPVGRVVGMIPGAVDAEDVYTVEFTAMLVTEERPAVEMFLVAELEAAG